MTTLAPDLGTLDQLEHLEDWDPACALPACEADNPTAQWIYRSNLGCGHDDCMPSCEDCRLRVIRFALSAIAQGMVAICKVCGFTKRLVVVDDAVTYEPLRGGQ